MKLIPFHIGSSIVPFYLGKNCLDMFFRDILPEADKYFFISDPSVLILHGQRVKLMSNNIALDFITISGGEPEKNFESLAILCSALLERGCTRSSIIIACGGGVIGNIAGLAAALLFRGIRLVHVPTTLLSMHDSVTSCKQAINHYDSKNIIGAYLIPVAVCIDISFLATLPQEHLVSGKAELVKNVLIFEDKEYEVIKNIISSNTEEAMIYMIEKGIEAKSKYLKEDPYEKKDALIFEYGHTIGHALEIYFNGVIFSHGEAVAWGMKVAAEVSNKLGILSDEELNAHQSFVDQLNLKIPKRSVCVKSIMDLVLRDNKRGYIRNQEGFIPMILLEKLGKVKIGGQRHPLLQSVPCSVVKNALETIFSIQNYIS